MLMYRGGPDDHIELLQKLQNSFRTAQKVNGILMCVGSYKLLNHFFHYDLRKHYFSARIVNIWNSLPNTVVDASTVNTFKERLDKFWSHQLVKFDFTADLTGTGNRSGVVIS